MGDEEINELACYSSFVPVAFIIRRHVTGHVSSAQDAWYNSNMCIDARFSIA